MNARKVKLLTLSILITTGLCVSVNLATPILSRNTEPLEKSAPPKHVESEPDLDPSTPPHTTGVRRSYAS